MAETLSYDNTPETEVLSSEEQDSLEVGEKLVAEQEGLLAGKYKNAEDLEQHTYHYKRNLDKTKRNTKKEKDIAKKKKAMKRYLLMLLRSV